MLKISAGSRTLTSLGLFFLCASSMATACGGSDDKKDGEAGPNGAQDSGISLSGGDGDGPLFLPDYGSSDGGTTKLSDDQVEDFLSAECSGAESEGERLPATLELVIDVSGSMNKTVAGEPPQAGEQSKWEITRAALLQAVDALPGSISFGAVYYPNMDSIAHPQGEPGPSSDCVKVDGALPLAPLGTSGSKQRAAFGSNIASVYVENYTPTHDAYHYALQEQLLPFSGPNKFILLITDGAPTMNLGCQWNSDKTTSGKILPAQVGTGDGSFTADAAPIVAEIRSAFENEGVRTFVIGAPGSEKSVEDSIDMRPWLSRAALEGGTGFEGCTEEGPNYCHFDMTSSTIDFSKELTSALARISGEVVDACAFKIPEPPAGETLDPNLTQVIVEWGDGKNELIHPDSMGDCEEGWRYNDEDQAVETCGATCARITNDPKAVVHVSFGCEQADFIVR